MRNSFKPVVHGVLLHATQPKGVRVFSKFISMLGPKPDPRLLKILLQANGGVYKRINENRELLEFLQDRAPKLLEECPWIVGWIQSNDEFLTALECNFGPVAVGTSQFSPRPRFPRPWPELRLKPAAQDLSSEAFNTTVNAVLDDAPPLQINNKRRKRIMVKNLFATHGRFFGGLFGIASGSVMYFDYKPLGLALAAIALSLVVASELARTR